MDWYVTKIGRGCILVCLIVVGVLLVSRTSPTNQPFSVISSAVPINPIVRENQKPGSQGWKSPNFDQYFNNLLESERLEHANQKLSAADSGSGGDPIGPGVIWTDTREVKGYANLTSVSVGNIITFHISSTAAQYDMTIYRMGWYSGDGATEALSAVTLPGFDRGLPTPDPVTGLIDANWPVSYTLNVPADWTSGIYLVWLQNVGSDYVSYIPFIVRDDSQAADVMYVVATTTWQAYNNWGGKSLYDYNSDSGTGRAHKVSYNRPYEQNDGSGHFYSGDFNMLMWLEQNGYDVTYVTSENLHSNPNLMTNRKVLLSDFHDEYYSMEMFDHVVAYRDAGKDLAYFTSNNIYWQVRYENDDNGNPLRTVVCYKKETEDPFSSLDPWLNDPDPQKSIRTTVLFRDAPVNKPENQVLGVMFESLVGYGDYFDWTVQNADNWIYDGTGLTDGETIEKLVGYEWDRTYDNGVSPANMTVIAETPIDYDDSSYLHQAVIWQAPSSAWVFASANNYWQYFLMGNYIWPLDTRIQRITQNVLNRMIADNPGDPTATPTSTASPTSPYTPSVTFTASATATASITYTPSRTFTATSTSTATDTPGPTTSVFYRAINVGGLALEIDGNTWEDNSDTTPDFTMAGSVQCNPWQPVTPPTDANRTTMIQCSRQHWAHEAVMSSVPNGTYEVYVYTWLDWEDPNPPNYNFYLQGQLAANYQSGPVGRWSRLGPWTANVTDGTLTLQTDGDIANISGIEVYQVVDATTATSTLTNTATATNTDLPAATATFTPSNTFTATATDTASATSTATNTDLPAATATFTPTATDTASATSTATNTDLPAATATDTASATSTATNTDLPAATATFTPSNTFTATATDTASATSTATNTDLPAATATFTPSNTFTATATDTASATSTATNTDLPAATATFTPTTTNTASATNTLTATATYTATTTNTPSATNTVTATHTSTSTPTLPPPPIATLTPTSTPTPLRRDTIGIFRPGSATFFFRNSNSTGVADSSITFGTSTDYPVVGDWNGDGIDTAGVYRRSTGQFYLTNSTTNPAVVHYSFTLGSPNDQPIVGDWDGDGKDGVGIYRPSTGLIYLKNSLTTGYADYQMVLGVPGDVGIAGDWDGNGKDSPGVYRPSNQTFYVTNQICNCAVFADYTVAFGLAADTPFVGDWNGDGRTGIGVYRRSNGITYLRNALTSGFADISFVFGSANDQPLAGIWTLPPGGSGVQAAPTFLP